MGIYRRLRQIVVSFARPPAKAGGFVLTVVICMHLSSVLFCRAALAGVSDGWKCVEESAGSLHCTGPEAVDEYLFSFQKGAAGLAFIDRLNFNSAGFSMSRTCEDYYTSFYERTCTVVVSAGGPYAKHLIQALGPGADRLNIVTRGDAMDVRTLKDTTGGAVKDNLILSYRGSQKGEEAQKWHLQNKLRRDFLSHYGDPIEDTRRPPDMTKEMLFKEWLEVLFSEQSLRQWDQVAAKGAAVHEEQRRSRLVQWTFAFAGFLLNVMTGYAFYRNKEAKTLLLRFSLLLFALAGMAFISALHPAVLAASFGLWSGLAFPFSLIAYPALLLVRLLQRAMEFGLLVQIIVGVPALMLSAAGSYFTWTRLLPGISPWIGDKMN